jgi:hypothetical protein
LGDARFEELIEEAGPGIAAAHSSRGCAFGDFDNDGDMDVLTVNLNEPPSLLRNDLVRRQSLGQGATHRHNEQSERNWRVNDRAVWREATVAGAACRIEFLFCQ